MRNKVLSKSNKKKNSSNSSLVCPRKVSAAHLFDHNEPVHRRLRDAERPADKLLVLQAGLIEALPGRQLDVERFAQRCAAVLGKLVLNLIKVHGKFDAGNSNCWMAENMCKVCPSFE